MSENKKGKCSWKSKPDKTERAACESIWNQWTVDSVTTPGTTATVIWFSRWDIFIFIFIFIRNWPPIRCLYARELRCWTLFRVNWATVGSSPLWAASFWPKDFSTGSFRPTRDSTRPWTVQIRRQVRKQRSSSSYSSLLFYPTIKV